MCAPTDRFTPGFKGHKCQNAKTKVWLNQGGPNHNRHTPYLYLYLSAVSRNCPVLRPCMFGPMRKFNMTN